MSLKLLFLSFTVSICAWAQVELVSNSWPTDPQGHKFFPDADVHYGARITLTDGTPLVNVPYSYTVKQYAGQGYHTHETAGGCCAISRPVPAFTSGETGRTAPDGSMPADLELNGYAGWYTVCANVANLQKCVNHNTVYYTALLNSDIPLERYLGNVDLVPQLNWPATNYPDVRHQLAGHLGDPNAAAFPVFWGTHSTTLSLLAASAQYKTDTVAGGFPDILGITRISLPDGGIYDNDAPGVAPGAGNFGPLNWSTRPFEEHARGVEVDITLAPLIYNQTKQFPALYAAGCRPGLFTADGASIPQNPPDAYWMTQSIMHVTCGRALRSTPLPRPRP